MKKQNNQSGRIILLTSVATMFLLGASVSAFAQSGAGKPFDARDPQACGDLKGKAPTQAKALNSFICHLEEVHGLYLHLIENATLQLSAGRPYNRNEDYNVGNIDATAPVYPIRGSFKKYTCLEVTDFRKNKGINCSITDHPKATGLCIKDTFGDWLCSMGDVNLKIIDMEAPPPGGSSGNAPKTENPNTAPKTAPKNDAKPEEKTGGDQADNGFPKPDFSEVEKYVDVIRYEYGDNVTDHNLYIVVKSKANNLPEFCAQFLDKDGIMIDASDSCGTGIHMGYLSPQAGQKAKFDVNMPYGNHMKRVVSVRIVAKQ